MKKIIAIFLTLGIILSYSAFAGAQETTMQFSDVDFTTEVGKDIQKLLNAGVVNGHGDGTFAPGNPVTRAELCKMVNKVRGYKNIADVSFTDVTPDNWYYTHVLIGKEAGYINGFPDGSFRGDDYVTREQVCAIICRAFGIYDLGLSAGVTDDVSDWAIPYVNALITNKLINMEEGNKFRATENMKRGELSTSLAKFVDVVPETDESGESKVPGDSSGTNTKPGNTGAASGSTKPGSGGSTGGSSGGGRPSGSGSSGGNSNSGSGGNSGNSSVNNEEVLMHFKKVYSEISGINFSGPTQQIVNIVKGCLEKAIKIGEEGKIVITKDFIYKEYASSIEEAKKIYYGLEETSQGEVLNEISNKVSASTKDYLMNMFL